MKQQRYSTPAAFDEKAELAKVVLDHAPIGFFRYDHQGHLLYCNTKAGQWLGYDTADLPGKTIFDIDPMMTTENWSGLWKRMCEQGILEFETIHRRKDGTTFPVNITCNLIDFEGSQYAISILRDLTGKKKAGQQKEMIEKRLRQAQRMESLGTLASGVAHDFNNILSAISGYAELARLRCSAHSKMQQYIDQICTASIRAKNLIKQILIFSRQGESKKRDIDISIVIRETLKLIQATLPSTIEVRHCIHTCPGDVFADDSQIHQIVMNLCTNAYHAMQQDGGLLEVALDRVAVGTYDSQCYPIISPGKYLKLTVSDTGVGIPADILSRIFEPYFSTKPTGEGTGMGLSAVHGIVEDHGGGIKVNSIQGVGTTVHVFLPLSAAASDPLDEDTVDASILIVDDERQLLNIGREYLEDMGYAVVTMDNPLDAIEAVRLNPKKFDLIITDLTMPHMTGEKLAGEIRKILSDTPIILCTGFDSYCEVDRLKALGIDHLLTKPINLDELDTVIHKLIR